MRSVGFAFIRLDPFFTIAEVVLGEPGDLARLGARTLEGLNLCVDTRRTKLVAAARYLRLIYGGSDGSRLDGLKIPSDTYVLFTRLGLIRPGSRQPIPRAQSPRAPPAFAFERRKRR